MRESTTNDRSSRYFNKSLELIAWHEAGHAICTICTDCRVLGFNVTAATDEAGSRISLNGHVAYDDNSDSIKAQGLHTLRKLWSNALSGPAAEMIGGSDTLAEGLVLGGLGKIEGRDYELAQEALFTANNKRCGNGLSDSKIRELMNRDRGNLVTLFGGNMFRDSLNLLAEYFLEKRSDKSPGVHERLERKLKSIGIKARARRLMGNKILAAADTLDNLDSILVTRERPRLFAWLDFRNKKG